MKRRTVYRVIVGGVILLLAILVAGWLAFVPWAKEPGYAFVKAWGEKGSGPGQFNDPTGIAVAGGKVFVADAFNRRTQKFTGAGAYLGQWSNTGRESDRLEYPAGVAIDGQGRMYVSDFFKNRIRRLDCR